MLQPLARMGIAAAALVVAVAASPPGTSYAVLESRVKDYLALHRKLESSLPPLGKDSTPAQIDHFQRELGRLIQEKRRNAVQGEFFTPEVQAAVKRDFDRIFAGPDGKNLMGSIMDENPNLPKLVVNERYPDDVPLSTMPPEVLEVLPKLDEDMEYRFVGRRLVLIDAHAHIIVDFTGNVLPK